MTIAEKNALRKERLDDLKSRIQTILGGLQAPVGLDEIVYYLQKGRLDQGEPLDADNSFDVRDAISELIRAGIVREVIGRDIELNRK